MRATVLFLLLLTGTLSGPPAAAQAHELRLDLNIPELVLRVYEGDRMIRAYPVSVGVPGHDTPHGQFEVQRAEWNPWWRPPAREWAKDDKVTPPGPNNPMGRVKLFFAPYYYLHGTPHEKDLGSPASHGCVRMKNADVIALATLLHQHARPTVSPSEIKAILAKPSTTRESTFRAPVPLTLRYDPVVVADGEIRIYRDFYKHGKVHSEGVVQALMRAGYEPAALDRATIRSILERAGKQKTGVFVARLDRELASRGSD